MKRLCRRCGKKTTAKDTLIQTAPGAEIVRACLCGICSRIAKNIMSENHKAAKAARRVVQKVLNADPPN